MTKTDADLLRKEIDKWKEAMADAIGEYSDGVRFALEHFAFVLDSLQQEQQEVDLEKEIKRMMVKLPFFIRGKDQIAFARHFAEWQASQMPMPEDTVLFQKGVAEGRRLMMEEVVEGTVNQDGILELSNGEAIDVCPSLDKCALGLQLGEKVKLIIVKDNDTE